MFIARTTNKAFSPILKNKQCLFANFSGMPSIKPDSPNFGSGPCKKRPGWTPDALSGGALGRSHRSVLGKAKLKEAIDLSKEVLGLPEGYHLGIVPASDTGAYGLY
jgi:phosphoserine aminotransferase